MATKFIGFKTDAALAEQLRATAQRKRESLSALIRRCLVTALKFE